MELSEKELFYQHCIEDFYAYNFTAEKYKEYIKDPFFNRVIELKNHIHSILQDILAYRKIPRFNNEFVELKKKYIAHSESISFLMSYLMLDTYKKKIENMLKKGINVPNIVILASNIHEFCETIIFNYNSK